MGGYSLIPSRKADVPPTPSTDPAREAPAGLSRGVILIFAIACGVCVAKCTSRRR